MQISFLRFCFSSILMFSEAHDFIRRLCFNTRAAVRKEQEVLEELKKISFSQNKFIMLSSFLGL